MIRVTKIFTFETAHILYGYDGKCKNIHGHSYKLFVTIKGKPIDDINNEKNGMVLDFGDLKAIVKEEIVDEWDHGLMVNALSPHKDLGKELEQKGHKVIYCDYQPTCENMLYEIADKIKKRLPSQVQLVYLKLHETENSYGEWFAEDNEQLDKMNTKQEAEKLFPDWKATPCVTGRIAKEEDVRNENAVFVIENTDVEFHKAYDMELPKLAKLHSDEGFEYVVVIQIEECVQGIIVGYKNADGIFGVGLFHEFEFLE